MRIFELLEPKKPETQVKSSTITKPGIQGSKNKITQRSFTTKKGNRVDIQFNNKSDGVEKETDVVFYVNGTMFDNASTEGKEIDNDFDVLSGVGYIVKQYLDKAKINKCTFTAYATANDHKTKFNIPIDKPRKLLISALDQVEPVIRALLATEDDESQRDKYHTILEVIPPVVSLISTDKPHDYSKELDKIYWTIRRANTMQLSRYPEMSNVITQFEKFSQVISSYDSAGAHVKQNRRFDVYSRILTKFFSSTWDIRTVGDNFILTRK